jgi:hypothetical protein
MKMDACFIQKVRIFPITVIDKFIILVSLIFMKIALLEVIVLILHMVTKGSIGPPAL